MIHKLFYFYYAQQMNHNNLRYSVKVIFQSSYYFITKTLFSSRTRHGEWKLKRRSKKEHFVNIRALIPLMKIMHFLGLTQGNVCIIHSKSWILLNASWTNLQFSCRISNIVGFSSIISIAFLVAVASNGGNAAEKQYPASGNTHHN